MDLDREEERRKRARDLAGLEEHCGGKKFVPKKFLLNNKLEEIKGLYVPFWVYNADLDGDVMYECVNERTWTSGNTEYTERKYYNVRRAGELSFDHVPADGSSKMPDDLMESIEPFDFGKAEDFTTAYLSGYVADKYDLDQDTVRPRVRKRLQEGTSDQFRTTVTGYDEVRARNVEISAKSSTVDYVLYPVWLMNTDCEGKKFYWDYDYEASINPFFAQVWYPLHDKSENNVYDESIFRGFEGFKD